MASLRDLPLVSTTTTGMGQISETQQAGRSDTALSAEADAAQLRSSLSDPALRGTSSSPLHIDTHQTQHKENVPPVPPSHDRPSHSPTVSSPLKPSSGNPRGAVSEALGGAGDVSPSNLASPSSEQITPNRSARNGINAARQASRQQSNESRSPSNSSPNASSANLAKSGSLRPNTPRTLKDLGRDYSRYPKSGSSTSLSTLGRPTLALGGLDGSSEILRTTTVNPFSDSQADLEKWGYPDDSIGAFDPYHGGEKGFILYSDEVEKDDDFHMPYADDDITYKPKMADYFDMRNIISTIGGILLVLGLLCVFVLIPVLTFHTHLFSPVGHSTPPPIDYGPAWAHVNNRTYPLLNNVRRGLIDPDTPDSAKTRQSVIDGSTLQLVFSDEFNDNNRTFYPGDDPFWHGADLWYGATQDLEWYDPDAVTTYDGTLQLRLDAFANHGLPYRSGMLNSWNQMCFKGGIFEVSVSLAGPAGIPGLWPGVWTMGNLGRPGYKATTEGVWPYTYNTCDYGITPNQSSTDGLSFLPGQKLSSCTCTGADHPSPGTGRGAPEIDILEGSVDPTNRIGVVTQSLQVAPFDVFWRPNSDFMAMPNYNTTQMNGYTGGPFQQAVSATTLLNNEWYDGNAYQKYAFEYVPGTSKGKIIWFVGEDPSFIMDGRAIGPNGNVAARQVPEEPLSMVLNLGISPAWGEMLVGDLKFPTIMHIDYVRIYQPPGNKSLTCDPPGYPTTQYIKDHPFAYNNANLTAWNETGYGWPKNTLTGC